MVDCVWNMIAHAQKPDFVFLRNGRIHLNRRGRQFSRLLAAEVCTSALVMLDTPCSEVVWRVLATHCIRQFPRHSPSRASLCAITFQLDPTEKNRTLMITGRGIRVRTRNVTRSRRMVKGVLCVTVTPDNRHFYGLAWICLFWCGLKESLGVSAALLKALRNVETC